MLATSLALTSCGSPSEPEVPSNALVIREQGSFAAGGAITTAPGAFDPQTPANPAGQTYHRDHAYAFYQIPENAHELPIVMWHGAGQFSKTWESTPDGREGFQNIFLRRGYGTYVVDQPRRGNAGRAMVGTTIAPTPDEQMWFNQFRVGVWPNYFDGVQFPQDSESLNQYFRAMTPNTGPFDPVVVSDGVSAILERTGPAILFTHSQSGGPGWSAHPPTSTARAPTARILMTVSHAVAAGWRSRSAPTSVRPPTIASGRRPHHRVEVRPHRRGCCCRPVAAASISSSGCRR